MKVADKDKLYDEVSMLEKDVRKKNPKQAGRVMVANAKSFIDMTIGRMDALNEVPWLMAYRDKLRDINS